MAGRAGEIMTNGYGPHPQLDERDVRVLHIVASLVDSPGRLTALCIAGHAGLTMNATRHSLRKLRERGLVIYGREQIRVLGMVYEPDGAVMHG